MLRGLSTIVRCEVASRGRIFLAVAVLGLVPLASPWLAKRWSQDPNELRYTMALALSLLVTFGGAIGLGAQGIVGKQVEGRLGFFLARPLSGWTLWWGHLVAIGLTLVLGWFLVWLPTLIVTGSLQSVVDAGQMLDSPTKIPSYMPWDVPHPFSSQSRWYNPLPGFLSSPTGWLIFWWTSGCALLCCLSHWLSMVFRLRTRWVLLDALLLGGMILFAGAIFGEFYLLYALREIFWSTYGLILWSGLAIVLAGGWQVERGGVDAARSHRVFSSWLWPMMGLALLLIAGYVQGLKSSGPQDLKSVENLGGGPRGDWVIVSGRTSLGGSYEPVFAYHPDAARHHLLGPRLAMQSAPVFSRSGEVLVWTHCPMGRRICDVEWMELEGAGRRVALPVDSERLRRFSSGQSRGFALSEDGRRLALALNGTLEVYDMPSMNLVAAHRMEETVQVEVSFESADRLRVYQQFLNPKARRLVVWHLGIEDGQWSRRADLPGVLQASHQLMDRMLIVDLETGWSLFDRWGEEEIGPLEKARPFSAVSWKFLSTGHLVGLELAASGSKGLVVYDALGGLVFRHRLEAGEDLLLGGEIESGRVLLGLRRSASQLKTPQTPDRQPWLGDYDRWRTGWFDVEAGLSETMWEGYIPVWQPAETFEQARWLMAKDGVHRLGVAPLEPIPVVRLDPAASRERP